MKPNLIQETSCDLMIKWSVKSACVPYLDICKYSYAGKLFDLNVLSHLSDSWIAHQDSKTYWLNLCGMGVLYGPKNSLLCPNTSAVCIHDSNKNVTEALSFSNQANLQVKNDGALVEIAFNNSKRMCTHSSREFSTIVLVRLKCGPLELGRPQVISSEIENKPDYLDETPDECITLFEWSTRLVCRDSQAASTLRWSTVEVTDGLVHDPNSHVKIEMKDVFWENNLFASVANTQENSSRYFIQFGAPKLLAQCNDSIICKLDTRNGIYQSMGTLINGYMLDLDAQIFEVSIGANTTGCAFI